MRRTLRIVAIGFLLLAAGVAVRSPDEAVLLLHSRIAPLDAPRPGLGEEDRRILGEVRVADSPGASYMHVRDDGSPVTFSPCRPWYFVINPIGAPPGEPRRVGAALAEVEAATGLRLIVEGRTDEAGSTERRYYQPDRYGDRWAPILVAWVASGDRSHAGKGGPALAQRWFGEPTYVSGAVLLNSRWDFDRSPSARRAVLLHEIAHVIGLDHSPDPESMMYRYTHGQTGFSAEDLAGLARLGRGECNRAY